MESDSANLVLRKRHEKPDILISEQGLRLVWPTTRTNHLGGSGKNRKGDRTLRKRIKKPQKEARSSKGKPENRQKAATGGPIHPLCWVFYEKQNQTKKKTQLSPR